MKTILICEDNENIAESYQKLLGDGFEYRITTSIAGLKAAMREASFPSPVLFVADLQLGDGMLNEAVFADEELRDCLAWPTLVVSVKEDQEILEKCLRGWARDYITKPFLHAEFIVKARKVLEGLAFYQRPFHYCSLSMRVTAKNMQSEMLTAQEARLFNYLVSMPSLTAKKEDLMQSVWDEKQESNKLTVTITRLRKKINPLGLTISYRQEAGSYQLFLSPNTAEDTINQKRDET